jgi:preprotein translocase subunit SecG
MRRAARLWIIIALCPGVLCAQGRRGGGGFGGGAGAGRGARGAAVVMDERTVLNLVTALLNLSDMQRQQVQTIFDAANKAAGPIATQMESSKDALFDAVKSGKSDDEIKTLAAQQGLVRTQILTLQAETSSKMLALLTSDQKAQVDDFIYDDIGQFLANAPPPLPSLPQATAAPTSPTAP